MNHLKPSDIIAAAAPTVSATLIAQANQIVGIIGSLLGIVYLLWRWRHEAFYDHDVERCVAFAERNRGLVAVRCKAFARCFVAGELDHERSARRASFDYLKYVAASQDLAASVSDYRPSH